MDTPQPHKPTLARFIKGVEQVLAIMPEVDTICLHPKTAEALGLVEGIPFIHNDHWFTVLVQEGANVPMDVQIIDLRDQEE